MLGVIFVTVLHFFLKTSSVLNLIVLFAILLIPPKFKYYLRPWGVAPTPHQFLKKLDKNS